jgi:prepilin-type N-terminal cleavage/methylation domain-containing protein
MKTTFPILAAAGGPARSFRRSIRRGFTLVELSLAMVMGSLAGAMILALFNQQIAFLQIYRTQNFLTEEAPIISAYLSRIIGGADRYRLHDSLDDALNGRNPRMGPSPVAVFNFRQPNGTMRATILSFEDRGEGEQLYYYVVPEVGVIAEPEWSVSSAPANVEFVVEQGILRVILTGPAGEQITYSGAMQL